MVQDRSPSGGGSFKSADVVTSGGIIDVDEPLIPIDPDNGPFTVTLGSGMEEDGRMVILTLTTGGGGYQDADRILIEAEGDTGFDWDGDPYDILQLQRDKHRPLVFDSEDQEWVSVEYNNFYPDPAFYP